MRRTVECHSPDPYTPFRVGGSPTPLLTLCRFPPITSSSRPRSDPVCQHRLHGLPLSRHTHYQVFNFDRLHHLQCPTSIRSPHSSLCYDDTAWQPTVPRLSFYIPSFPARRLHPCCRSRPSSLFYRCLHSHPLSVPTKPLLFLGYLFLLHSSPLLSTLFDSGRGSGRALPTSGREFITYPL